MLDTRTYEIEFPDGRSDEYTTNVIAENMYSQCDIEGREYNLMEGIVDHKTDGHVVEPDDMYIKHGSNKKVRKTTKGWNLCVEWKDGNASWELLSDLTLFSCCETLIPGKHFNSNAPSDLGSRLAIRKSDL
jgi:hypothetical protein